MIFSKKQIGVLLLISLLSMPLIFRGYFYFAQIWIEHSMEEAMETKNLQTISIPTEEIVWVKKGKEMLIKNQLFDVKSYKKQGTLTIIKGLYDLKENELKNKLLAFNLKKESKERKQVHVLQIIFLCLYPPLKSSFSDYPLFVKQHPYRAYKNDFIHGNFVSIPVPPPQPANSYLLTSTVI
jgi:hypothetical protein